MMKAVVLLSGGIDSAVLLASLLADGDYCHAVHFNYGQASAQCEEAAARVIAYHYSISSLYVQKIEPVFAPNALTGTEPLPVGHAETPDVTTVPGRNLIMLAMGAALAETLHASAVMFGAIRDDHKGYADCRQQFITAADHAVFYGTDHHVSVGAPLTWLSKADVVAEARRLNVPLELTWSCYSNGPEPCGKCGACQLREAALS